MIRNNKQYEITKSWVAEFQSAREKLQDVAAPPDVEPDMRQIQEAALRNQYEELQEQITEYEALRAGKITDFTAASIIELPSMLVKARIASGRTEGELAKALGVPVDTINLWEENEYYGASVDQLKQSAEELHVCCERGFETPIEPNIFRQTLSDLGLPLNFIRERLLPPDCAPLFDSEPDDSQAARAVQYAVAYFAKVLGMDELPVRQRRKAATFRSATVRPRLAAGAGSRDAGMAYATYLAQLVANREQSSFHQPPADPQELRRQVIANAGAVSFETLLEFLWENGIPVLPLVPWPGFAGGLWMARGTPVVVFSVESESEATSAQALLSTIRHIADRSATEDKPWLLPPQERVDADESTERDWIREVLLPQGMADMSSASVDDTKLVALAEQYQISPSLLADLLGISPPAADHADSPFSIAQSRFWENMQLDQLHHLDADLLARAITG